MQDRSWLSAIAILAALWAPAADAQADLSRYPDLKGQWVRWGPSGPDLKGPLVRNGPPGFNSTLNRENGILVEELLRRYGVTSSGETFSCRETQRAQRCQFDYTNVQGTDNRIDEPDQIRIAVKRSAECPR